MSNNNIYDLSELPENWCWTKLGNLVEIRHGYSFRSEDFGDSGAIVLTPGNFTENGDLDFVNKRVVRLNAHVDKQWILRNGDLLVVMTDLSQKKLILGSATILNSEETVLHNQRIGLVLPYSEYISRFYLRYAIISPRFKKYIDSTASGSLISHTSPKKLLDGLVPIAPFNEQRRIVAKIEALKARSQRVKDALLDIPQLLDQFRQSVLAAAFRGDLTADWREQNPDVEPASVLLERIQEEITHQTREKRKNKNEFCHSLKQNFNNIGIVNLPEPWQLIQIRQICIHSFYGPRFGKDEYVEDGIPSIRTTDMTDDGHIILQNPPKLNIPKDKVDDFRVLPGDLLITRSGSIGVMAVFRGDYIAIPSAYLIRFRFSLMINIDYIFYYLKSPVGQTLLGLNSTSVTQSNINAEAIKNIPIPIPPLEEQQEIVRRIKSLLKFINQIKQQYQETKTNLDQLDQSILAKAFRGELVPQDSDDEPASVLLERIRAERDKLETKTAKKSTAKTSTRRTKNTQLQAEEPVQLELGLE